jgi:transposase
MDAFQTNPLNWCEWRRLQVVRLKRQGWHQRDIAPALGVREEIVSRWLARARQCGPEGFPPGFCFGGRSAFGKKDAKLVEDLTTQG